MRLLVRAGVALALGLGASVAAPDMVLAGPDCSQDDCDFWHPARCTTGPSGPPGPNDTERRYLDPLGEPEENRPAVCKDCDGAAEGRTAQNRGTCIRNYYDFSTQYYNCVTQTRIQLVTPPGSPPQYGWGGVPPAGGWPEYYHKYQTHRGLECGRTQAAPLPNP